MMRCQWEGDASPMNFSVLTLLGLLGSKYINTNVPRHDLIWQRFFGEGIILFDSRRGGGRLERLPYQTGRFL